MRFLLIALLTFWVAPSVAEEGPVVGRMSCEIKHVRFVATQGGALNDTITRRQDFLPGMTLGVDYRIGDGGVLTLMTGTPDRPNGLISETFAPDSYRGISPFTGSAEFRAGYSELTLGRYGINYKGNDQLHLRLCGESLWQGQFVHAHVSGLFTQVLSLECRAGAGRVESFLGRLAGRESQ